MAIDLSRIQVREIQTLESSFRVNLEAEMSGDNNAVNLKFKSSDLTDTDEGLKRLEAMLIVESKASDNTKTTYSAKVVVRGLFLGDDSDDHEDDGFSLFMKYNAYSLLYGFVRNHVQQLSSMSPLGQVNLPCVDVRSIAESIQESECQ